MLAKLGSTPGKGALSTAFIIITLLSLLIFLSPDYMPHLLQLSSTKCILYDRPPRTGSTTISKALGKCMRQKNYAITNHRGIRSMTVETMLSSSTNLLSSVSSHVAISKNDLARLKWECGELLYITSCAPMKKRIYSAAKYAMVQGHGNGTVEGDKTVKLHNYLERHDWAEAFLEAYPHVTDLKRPLGAIPQRIVPDYVIRKESADEDLKKLLSAFGCDSSSIERANVHSAKFDEEKVLSGIELKMGDTIYDWLMDVAKGNERGLEKARWF